MNTYEQQMLDTLTNQVVKLAHELDFWAETQREQSILLFQLQKEVAFLRKQWEAIKEPS